MSAGKKVLVVGGIVLAVIIVELFLTAVMPAIAGMTSQAVYTGNNSYPGFNEAVRTSPIWLYIMPVLIGGIAAIIVLRLPEQQ